MTAAQPVRILIAAMGGEGGGVLTNWIVSAATMAGFPVQSTSIPGVAQRTGATTYYIEVFPMTWGMLGSARPVLGLVPSAGAVDLVAASELVEAARTIAGGFVTNDRTVLIGSTHRVFAISEKSAGGDGRFDTGRLFKAIEDNARRAILFDIDETSRAAGSVLSATMMGAIAGSAVLPIAPETFAAAIRAEGKAVDINLRGFEAGLAAARGGAGAVSPVAAKRTARAVGAEDLVARAMANLPESVAAFAVEGVRRLAGYQDPEYAALYLERMSRVLAAEHAAGGDGRLSREAARHLAVRMSYEDVIRVAQLKTDPARFQRIEAEARGKPGEPVVIVDHFKPGIEELCAILPPLLARRILLVSRRRGWIDRAYVGMNVRTSTVTGFLRLWLLARLRPWRRCSHRFAEEQVAIEQWLARIVAAAPVSLPLAAEIADCARLVKGYGETHRRGSASFTRVIAELADPAIAGHIPAPFAVDAIASARTAALADPEGDSLARTLAAIHDRGKHRAAAE